MDSQLFELPTPTLAFVNAYHEKIDKLHAFYDLYSYPQIPEDTIPEGIPNTICEFSLSKRQQGFLIMYMQLNVGTHQGKIYHLWLLRNDPHIYLEKLDALTFDTIEKSRPLTVIECRPVLQLELNFLPGKTPQHSQEAKLNYLAINKRTKRRFRGGGKSNSWNRSRMR